MAFNIVESDEFSTPISVPQAGELGRASDLSNVAQRLANRSLWLQNRSFGARPAQHYAVPLSGGVPSNSANIFFQAIDDPSSAPVVWKNNALSATAFVTVGFLAPEGGFSQIVEVNASYLPASGHGALPTQLPRLTLFRQGLAGANAVILAQQTDNPGNVAAYEAGRTLTIGALTVNLSTSDTYYLQFRFEGLDGVANGILTRLGVKFSPV